MSTVKLIEIAGVLSAILYLLLATRRSRSCWVFFIFSSVLYFPVFWSAHLYADAWLQVYFVAMGLWGWGTWKPNEGADVVAVVSWPFRRMVSIAAFILVIGLLLGYALSFGPAGVYGYPDGVVTVGSVVTTILTACRVLQGWLLWFVINVIATVLYLLKGLDYTVGLYALFAVLALSAFWRWQRDFLQSDRCVT